ncbi:MAG TPA: NUDIX domain-containing protein [Chloroflexota bacterium]|nr:NUDIX domain-containing protein [Chloroflexota bacterium]
MDLDVAAPAPRPWAQPAPPRDWQPGAHAPHHAVGRGKQRPPNGQAVPAARPVAVDLCVFTVAPHPEAERDALQVVLTRRDTAPLRDWWALPGGPLGRDESLGDAAARVLAAQTGVAGAHLEQLASFGDPGRDPWGTVSVAYLALVAAARVELPGPDAARPAAWVPVDRLAQVPLAFDHAAVLDVAVTRLRSKLKYSNIAFELVPARFTLRQLYRAYLAILDRTERQLPFSNFLRVFGRLAEGPADDGFGRSPPLRVVGESRPEGPGRPARLYEFVGRPGDERREFYRW